MKALASSLLHPIQRSSQQRCTFNEIRQSDTTMLRKQQHIMLYEPLCSVPGIIFKVYLKSYLVVGPSLKLKIFDLWELLQYAMHSTHQHITFTSKLFLIRR